MLVTLKEARAMDCFGGHNSNANINSMRQVHSVTEGQ